ncbi:MAG: hypothetical protein NZ937_09770, partial [Armatimonadetes bacterium]|nr:hypothetical protein [Armatimonadota bacterium]
MLRKDYIDLQTNIIQSPFGGNAMTILTINGQASHQPQPIVVSSKEDCVRLVLAIWRAETGKDWELRKSVEIPTPSLAKIFKERIRQEMAGFEQYMGSQSEDLNLSFIAESDGLVRNGMVSGSLLVASSPHPVAATQGCFLSTEVTVSQTPTSDFEKARSIFSGFFNSFTHNPEWIMTTMEIWSQEWRDELRFVRQMLQEHREFNTRMATAWTNLLSDQTYTKDPETGE